MVKASDIVVESVFAEKTSRDITVKKAFLLPLFCKESTYKFPLIPAG